MPVPASASPRPSAEPRPDEVVRAVRAPGGGSSRRRYDLLGRVQLEERPDGSWLRYRYDESGRPAAVEHSSGERVEYGASEDGREWRARTDRTETTIRIDEYGFPAEVETAIDGRSLVVSYRRDSFGRVTALSSQVRGLAPVRDSGAEKDRLCSGFTGADGPSSHGSGLAPDRWLWFEREAGRLVVRAGERVYCIVEDAEGRSSATFANGVRLEESVAMRERPRLERVVLQDRAARTVFDVPLSYGSDDRVCDAGGRASSYDEEGRLTSWGDLSLAYDGGGRLVRRGEVRLSYGEGAAVTGAGSSSFDVDVLGRRSARHGSDGTTRYAYDLFDRLVRVELPAGGTIRYVYDGFGRLVAREHDGEIEYYAVGIDGHRLARAAADGTVTDSYLWLGEQCVGRLAGPIGGPLVETFHRADGAGLEAVGSAEGAVDLVSSADPFGSDRPIDGARPGYAGLFGDPLTGYLHAGARWLDPLTAQFLTPDSWFCEDVGSKLPPPLAPLLALLPGGAVRITDAVAAYAWCGYDPINRWDPGGHNWLGLIFSTISALLWEMQLNSLALQMEVLNVVIWLVFTIIGGFKWAEDFYDEFAIYNLGAPTASARLMVPFAFPLNGVLRFRKDRAWTLGNVIWVSGSRLERLEKTSKRDLLVCSNASSYLSAVEDVATTNTFRVRNPNTLRTGTVSNVGAPTPQITGIAPATTDVFTTADFVAVRIPATTTDEVRKVDGVVSATELRLAGPPLPKDVFDGKKVEIRRLDPATVRASGGGKTLAREVTFIRGTAIHFKGQTPENYLPNEGLTVTEFLPAEKPRRVSGVSLPAERVVVRLAAAADRTGYATGNFVRLITLGQHFARRITATPGDADLVIDSSLPAGDHTDVEVVRLDRVGAVATAQTAVGDRVRAGRLVDVAIRDGLAVDTTPPGPVPELRIVLELLLDCTVAPLPLDVQGTDVVVDLLVVGAATLTGKVASSTEITLNAAPAAALDAVRVTKSGGPTVFDVADPTSSGTSLKLKEPLPAAYTAGTQVTVRPLESPAGATPFTADQVVAPGDHVFVHVIAGNAIGVNDIIRVRKTAEATGGAARLIGVAPTVVAKVDSALPAALTTNLRVQRLQPNDPLKRTGATAPEVRQRLTLPGATNPYAANDVLSIVDGERTVAQVAAVDGQNVVLTEPIVGLALNPLVTTLALTATGISSTDGKLDEGLVLIPSDPDEPPLTRREAVLNHEMRHVFQGAVWGPFLVSLPIPWLLERGFSFTRFENSASKVIRHISLGGLDTIFALAVWGIGSRSSAAELEGEVVNDARTLVRFPQLADEAKVEKFSDSSRVDVRKGEADVFNVVEKRDDRDVTLRFALDKSKFAVGDTVKLSVSPFERIRKIVSIAFGNFEQLWSDHIPSSWGRAVSRLLNADSWFPFLGIYFLAYYIAGGDEERLWNEQDAAYHSGDLYTNFGVTRDRKVFVGQFARLFGFVETRGQEDVRFGVSELGALNLLEVQLPSGVTAADVAGGIASGADRVRFREHYYIPLQDRVENAVGVFFSTSVPGEYTVRAVDDLDPNDPKKGVVFTFAFNVSFLEARHVTVADIGVTPAGTDFFETEVVDFRIDPGDSSAEYRLRPPLGTTGAGKFDGLRYTAPVLAAGGAPVTEKVEITATYGEDHPVFHGSGQVGAARLALEERTNLCKKLELTISEITAPTLAPVKAGATEDFEMPVAPVSATVRPLPAGTTGNANVIIRPGRPATLTFVAPAAVTATVTATIDMVFGTDPAIRKPVSADIQITP